MEKQWLLVCVVGTLLAASLTSAASATRSVDGFLQAGSPIQMQGVLSHEGGGQTLWMQSGPAGTDATLNVSAAQINVTAVTLEIRSAHTPGPLNFTARAPGDGVSREEVDASNATLEIEDVQPTADVLFYPQSADPLISSVDRVNTSATVRTDPDGFMVRDGFRESTNANDSGRGDFDWSHNAPGPLIQVDGLPEVSLAGHSSLYVWGVNATLQNETGVIQRFETGSETQSQNGGAVQYERYTYLLVEARGLSGTLDLDPVDADLYGSAVSLALDGTARIPQPEGTLTTDDGSLHAPGHEAEVLTGDLVFDATPSAQGSGDGITLGVRGTVTETSIPVRTPDGVSNTGTVAAAAGGATALGLAAWYAVSVKGVSLASVPLVGRRVQRERPEPAAPDVEVEQPGDLLFDPDRFALYHLVRSRPGLSAQTCRETAGVPGAGEQLELMVDHGLLEVVSDEPRRYMLPGSLDDEEASKVVLLREPGAQRVAELLAVHGLAPEQRLLNRAEAADAPIDAEGARDLLERFVEHGLAYREDGPDGIVADSTDELHQLLERMGETSVPRVS